MCSCFVNTSNYLSTCDLQARTVGCVRYSNSLITLHSGMSVAAGGQLRWRLLGKSEID